MPTPDATIETPAGRCSLWWRETASNEGRRTGYIGATHGDAPLAEACARLLAEGCSFAIGPLDGTTWRRYRLVTDRGTEPPFLLEPWNEAKEVARWERAGFSPIRHYTSAIGELGETDPRAAAHEVELAKEGYRVRNVRLDEWDAELDRSFPILTASFAQNFLYTPLPRSEYLDLYRPMRGLVDPATNFVVEKDGAIVGLFFTYPASKEAIVLKTLAVHPAHEGKGLGGVLAARTIAAARAAGFHRGIHALMEESNRSQKISRHYGAPMRRYALFGRAL